MVFKKEKKSKEERNRVDQEYQEGKEIIIRENN